jgi:probable FeS assembly SUF system protein SufT
VSRYEEVELTRDCPAVQVPQGTDVILEAGTPAVIMQSLGDSYTVQVPTLGATYRIAGSDADALGKTQPRVALEAAATLQRAGQPVSEDVLRTALADVYDPEIPVSIVDLGLIYEMRIAPRPNGDSDVRILMTLTAPGCGMGQIIAADVRQRLERLPGVAAVEVEVVWEPAWSPQRISPAGRKKLGLD